MSLPKKNRLSLRKGKEIFLDSRRYYSSHFSLTKSTSTETVNPQFAIVISKKVSRLAHKRHKIRRLTSAAIYELLDSFPAGYHLVFPKSSILNTPFADLLSDLSVITKKLQTQI